MNPLTHNPLRLATDLAHPQVLDNHQRAPLPTLWRGSDTRLHLALLFNGEPASVTHLATLTLEVRPLNEDDSPPSPDTPPLCATTTSTFDTALTLADWNNGSAQHATLDLSAAQTNLPESDHWFTLYATTTGGHTLMLAAGRLRVLPSGGPASCPLPPEVPEGFYRRDEADLLFLRRSSNLADLTDPSLARQHLQLDTPPTAPVDFPALLLPASGDFYPVPLTLFTSSSTGTPGGAASVLARENRLAVTTASAGARMNIEVTSGGYLQLGRLGDGDAPDSFAYGQKINFDLVHVFQAAMMFLSLTADLTKLRWSCGLGSMATTFTGNPTGKGFGFLLRGNALYAWVHNGTTFTESASPLLAAPVIATGGFGGVTRRLFARNNGDGSVLFSAGGVTTTLTGGPTGYSDAAATKYRWWHNLETLGGGDANALHAVLGNLNLWTA